MLTESATVGLEQLRPEARALLLCSRARPDAEATSALRALIRSGLDWDELVRLARENAVTSLTYTALQRLDPQAVPAGLLGELRAAHMRNVVRNLLAERELLDLVDRLEGAGIPVVAFKGPLLAVSAYGDGALREYIDLDVLVRPHDADRALALLREWGYRPILALAGAARLAYFQSECALDLANADDTVLVELHWDLMPAYFSLPFNLRRVWSELETGELGGRGIRSLGLNDLLLFLCMHGGKHRWEQLRWVSDVAELIRSRPDLDWSALSERARAMGAERMVLLGVHLAGRLLGAPLPDAVARRAAADATVSLLADSVVARLFSDEPEAFADRNLFYLRAMESPWQRLRYCLHVLLVPTKSELAERRLPAALSPLHYPLHVLGILGQAVQELAARLRGAGGRGAASPAVLPVPATPGPGHH